MRGISLPLMAMIAMAVFSISCTPERELFSDTVVKEEVGAAPARSAEPG